SMPRRREGGQPSRRSRASLLVVHALRSLNYPRLRRWQMSSRALSISFQTRRTMMRAFFHHISRSWLKAVSHRRTGRPSNREAMLSRSNQPPQRTGAVSLGAEYGRHRLAGVGGADPRLVQPTTTTSAQNIAGDFLPKHL